MYEIEILKDFLPAKLSSEEIEAMIEEAISSTGASSIKDMGKVMATLKERHAGSMDFSKASGMVKDILGV